MVSNDTSCRRSGGICACHMMGGSHGFLYYRSRGLDVDMQNSTVFFSDSPTNAKFKQRGIGFLAVLFVLNPNDSFCLYVKIKTKQVHIQNSLTLSKG